MALFLPVGQNLHRPDYPDGDDEVIKKSFF
jgi:hypothetical protein